MRHVLLTLVGVVLLSLLASTAEAQSCTTDSDCGGDCTCDVVVGYCRGPVCSTDSDCGGPNRCDGGRCLRIQLNKEVGGDIDKGARDQWDGIPDNNRLGAQVWNGSEWIVNNSWAHTYFTNRCSGQRLIPHDITAVDASGTYGDYQVTRGMYSYSVPGRSCGTYRYEAVEYTIEQPDGKVILLRSRVSGNGTAQAFFNIYIQDPYDGDGTTALRGDPVQFDYPGLGPAAAAGQPDEEGAMVVANLPTANSQYWLDVEGGSDMGGYSYHLVTGAIRSRIRDLGSSFPTAFDVQYYDSASGSVKEWRFAPEVLSEQFDAAVCAAPAPALHGWALGAVALGLTLLGMRSAARRGRRQPRGAPSGH